jgi:hypothetical protein
MLIIKHATPGRVRSHLQRLLHDGEALLAAGSPLTLAEEGRWQERVWRALEKIVADRHAFDGVVERDLADAGVLHELRPKTPAEIDRLIRRRIQRRLGTLASVIEKVEAHAEWQRRPPGTRISPHILRSFRPSPLILLPIPRMWCPGAGWRGWAENSPNQKFAH